MTIFSKLAQMVGLAVKPTPHVSITPTAIAPQTTLISTPMVGAPVVKRTGPTIAVINNSSVLNDPDVAAAVAAMQIQIDRDFAPVWELDATLIFVGKNQPVPTNVWTLYLLDHSDQQGALGYHDMTPNGLPTGKVFAADDKQYNLSWTVTLSHELLEMLLDPWIDYTVFVQQTNTTGVLFALEVCDACENDSFGYEINGILVSDFVFPSWFEAFRTANSTQFSFKGSVHRPFEIAEGGYIGYFEVSSSATGWQQATGQNGPGQRLMSKLNRPESRLNRRSTKFYDVKLNKLEK